MSDCLFCPVEPACHYLYKPCECVQQRKFWSLERRQAYDEAMKTARQTPLEDYIGSLGSQDQTIG